MGASHRNTDFQLNANLKKQVAAHHHGPDVALARLSSRRVSPSRRPLSDSSVAACCHFPAARRGSLPAHGALHRRRAQKQKKKKRKKKKRRSEICDANVNLRHLPHLQRTTQYLAYLARRLIASLSFAAAK